MSDMVTASYASDMTVDQVIDELTIIRDRLDGGSLPVRVVVESSPDGQTGINVDYLAPAHAVVITGLKVGA